MMSVSAACVFQFTPLREGRRQIHVLRQTRHISIHAPPRGATRCNRHRSYRQQISIHAPPRGATRGGKSSEGSKNFNSRPSARGDPTSSRHERRRRPFQFTPLREGRLNRALCGAPDTVFQFTPLREGRPSKVVPSQEEEKFQFTPLREGRRERAEFAEFARPISIHAPPRGATAVSATMSRLRDFNSRPSARGDVGIRQQRVTVGISIHAPPRGATLLCPRSWHGGGHFNSRPSARGDALRQHRRQHHQDFNSRPSARGDEITELKYDFTAIFQFTPLREGRRRCVPCCRCLRYFNSRPSARGDRSSIMAFLAYAISIHAPPRGATARQNVGDCIRVFQFTPLREGRRHRQPTRTSTSDFNSRPSARGDRLRCAIGVHHSISIHAPPRGATGGHVGCQLQRSYFNSRPSARGDSSSAATRMSAASTFQFTPLREGRQCGGQLHQGASYISIHAPPRGATLALASSNR